MRRAVVLVGGPAAPYARALRIARAIAAEGFAVEIAAVAEPGLPTEERVEPPAHGSAGSPEPPPSEVGPITIRRYAPSGPWAFLGATRAARSPGDATPAADAAGPAPRARARARAVSATATIGRWIGRPVLRLRRWLFWPHTVRGWWATLERELAPADLYHAFGTLTIAAALAARDRSPIGPSGIRAAVIYDAVDDAMGSNASLDVPDLILRRRNRIETRWARSADAVLTVNDELADRLKRRWRLADVPLVVRNTPESPGADLVPVDLRAEAGLPAGTRVALFQGRLGPDRGLEASAEAILSVPDAALVLLGFGPGTSAAQARDREPRFRGRHVTLPPRHPDELLAWTAGADVSLIPLPPLSANQRASTPNKFWESLTVGTPVVVVNGLDVMERLVLQHDLGVVAVSAEPEDLAIAIRAVLDRIDGPDGPAWRAAIRQQAADRFSWPPTATVYRSLVRSLSERGTVVAGTGTIWPDNADTLR